jgi:hypothetical protein
MPKNGGRILKRTEMPDVDLLILEIQVWTPLSAVQEKGAVAEVADDAG